EKKTLTQKELNKTWWDWICWGQICYNWERLMGLGFCHTMTTAIQKLYGDNEAEKRAALTRHMEYYNTENTWGAIVPGIVCSLEEERANGGDVDADAIRNLKTALMGPLAGIGDTVTQSLVKVILLGVGIDMAKNGNPLGPILFVVLFSVYAIGVSRFLFFRGYKLGKESVVKLLSGGMVKRVTESLGVVGMAVLGALVAKNIGVVTPLDFHIGEMEIVMQDLLDSIIPKLIPLVIFLIVYRQLKKGKKPTTVMVYMMIASVILSLLGILA
ncbi:PTS system mannose/fructose/sorbose family transporter subunit IID, partial [Stecheria intestinalis]|uniref:PTS system mannose/fructose/sorbose family transporter subunit IID n=1 Tax=Stecheria intestinalis TaxID=2606630 RepID=UPI0023F44E54